VVLQGATAWARAVRREPESGDWGDVSERIKCEYVEEKMKMTCGPGCVLGVGLNAE
jgi:hypothetical protein